MDEKPRSKPHDTLLQVEARGLNSELEEKAFYCLRVSGNKLALKMEKLLSMKLNTKVKDD